MTTKTTKSLKPQTTQVATDLAKRPHENHDVKFKIELINPN